MIIVGNPISPPPKAKNSHVYGWAAHWAESVNGTINHGEIVQPGATEELWIEHGVNFSGGLNLFGGLTDKTAESIVRFVETWTPGTPLYSCDIPMPDYASMLRGRLGASSTSKLITEHDINQFGKILETAKTVTQNDLGKTTVCIGDSHTAAYAEKGSAAIRKNGQTLYGALKSGYLKDVLDSLHPNTKNVDLCFGSIDIRHHLFRQEHPYISVDNMIKELGNLVRQYDYNFKFCTPVPVEFEGRKIPQTGYYKKTPFFGSLAQRQAITVFWRQTLLDEFGVDSVIIPPLEWYTMDPEHYAKSFMERGGSVHISPEHYRRNGWAPVPLVDIGSIFE